jgi:hypothetical protein
MKPVTLIKQSAAVGAVAFLVAGAAWGAIARHGGATDENPALQGRIHAAIAPDRGVTSDGEDRSRMRRTLIQAKLQKTLQEAGFKSVQIMDAAYIVQAKTPDGEDVLMLVNRPSESMFATDSASHAALASPQTISQANGARGAGAR